MRAILFAVLLAGFAMADPNEVECRSGRAAMCLAPGVERSIADQLVVRAGDCVCGTKTYCKEMDSCAEAVCFLEECGLTRLDGDGDGVPCEAICR